MHIYYDVYKNKQQISKTISRCVYTWLCVSEPGLRKQSHPHNANLVQIVTAEPNGGRNVYSGKNGMTWWRHQMETFSELLALCAGKSSVTGEFSSQRPVTRSFDIFLICTYINGYLNNRKAGDLRHRRAHYDVTVMYIWIKEITPILKRLFNIPMYISSEIPWERYLWPVVVRAS